MSGTSTAHATTPSVVATLSPDFDQQRHRDWYDLRYLDRNRDHAHQCRRHTCLRTLTSTVNGACTISGTSSVPDRKLSQPAKTVSCNVTRNNAGTGTISGTSTATNIRLSVSTTPVSGFGLAPLPGPARTSGTSYVTDRKLSHLAKTVCGNSTRNNAGAGPISRTSTATDIKLSGIATHVTEL